MIVKEHRRAAAARPVRRERKEKTAVGFVMAALLISGVTFIPATTSAAAEQTSMAVGAPQDRRDWFRDLGYGLFIHWAPMVVQAEKYSGAELSYSRGGAKPDSWGGSGMIPADVYDASYRTFNPSQFDAAAIVAFAMASGMKYITITARHHDGFSMFDSAVADNNNKITSTDGAYRVAIGQQNPTWTDAQINARTDIIRELADAAHAGGIGFGVYYSEPDWRREDYRIAVTGKTSAGVTVSETVRSQNRQSYQNFMHAQLRELTTNYGKIDILWFDATKPSQGYPALYVRPDTIDMIRSNQPGILINDRTGEPADFTTPELIDAVYQPGIYQESSARAGITWSYHRSPGNPSPTWIVERLAINNSRDANFHLNLGPSPAGKFHAQEQNQVLAAGAFINAHADAFSGTRAGTVNNRTDYVTTRKGDETFLHILADSLAGKEVAIPDLLATSAVRWDDGAAVSFRVSGGATFVRIPSSVNAIDEIIRIRGITPPVGAAPVSGKTYTLTAAHSNQLATIGNSSTTNGARAVQWPRVAGATNQYWKATAVSGGFTLTNVATGKCLSVAGGATGNNAPVDQWTCLGGTNQVWRFTGAPNGANYIAALNSGRCLDVPGANTATNTALTQYDCVAAANQRWILEPIEN
ncbi:alpha-L-fucosidase [Lysobacter capsici]|uniref:alpha-L-fucosidase n=1 Tax=Lysobacter capsici TaxID=435897 RepID=UPI0018DF1F6F|nr:alpha-L-fucosidase [Lysobacter capsici]